MQFDTYTYALFLPLVFFIYWGLRKHLKWQNLFLLVASYVFYGWWDWRMLSLILLTSVSTWGTALMMRGDRSRGDKAWAAANIVLNMGILCVFKYLNFLRDSFVHLLGLFGMNPDWPTLHILLPVGISFYTFQAISYTVDVYKGKFTTETSLLEYTFYLTFFPLLMAGPITRAETLIPQIKHRYHIGDTQVYNGLWLIMSGMLKKALIADYIAQYNNWIFDDPTAYSGFENAMGVLGYTLQIYCDFSGYSDISIGLASLLGIELKENFRFPYQSLNLQEFWHRWHISLSTWFRDYVYIPLGGNRCGKVRTYVNNFITMLVAGLWHGASWMFVIWGALHGIGGVVHKFCKQWLDLIPNHWYVRFISWLITFSYVALAWTFFRAPDLTTATTILGHIGSDFSISYLVPFVETRMTWTIFVVLGFGLHAIREQHVDRLRQLYINSPWTLKLILLFVVLQVVINYRLSDIQPFIYAQF